MPVFPVSVVVDLIATKVIVCMAMVDCRCLALMQHERQARQLQRPCGPGRAGVPRPRERAASFGRRWRL